MSCRVLLVLVALLAQLWGPSGAGVWSSPTVDLKRRRIYVTTGNSHSDPTATTSDAFVAFDLVTGEQRWHAPHPGCGSRAECSPGQSAAVTAIPGVVFSGGQDGHLRAYSAHDGRILSDVDTMRDYATVNGVPGRGGSLDGPGPIVVKGMLYVTSGYAHAGTTPGNVLLAFSPNGR